MSLQTLNNTLVKLKLAKTPRTMDDHASNLAGQLHRLTNTDHAAEIAGGIIECLPKGKRRRVRKALARHDRTDLMNL